MAPTVTVHVMFALDELPTLIDSRVAAVFLSREEPRWSIGDVGRDSFRLGRYDTRPVVVTFHHGATIRESARAMAANLPSATPQCRAHVAASSGRFDLCWDLLQDPGVVPETALLVVACAQAVARLVDGVALVDGRRVLARDAEMSFGQAYSALFPAAPFEAPGRTLQWSSHLG